jgi:hypothetical protein
MGCESYALKMEGGMLLEEINNDLSDYMVLIPECKIISKLH